MSIQNNQKVFKRLLINALVSTTTTSFVWFAVTFWVFLQTKSILATSLIAGIFTITNMATALFFGAIVDHNKKKTVMIGSALFSLAAFAIGTIVYYATNLDGFTNPTSFALWAFITILMIGVIVGNIRNIAMSTCVTLLFPEGERDKANGMIGTTQGISFAVTSVFSGLVIGFLGMQAALLIALCALIVAIVHLLTVNVPEKDIVSTGMTAKEKVDFKGTYKVVLAIPGLISLIFFTTFNNFLGGVFMALSDAYGLSLVSVQTWGIMLGFLSFAFIGGGMFVAKYGLGKNPVSRLFLVNSITWITCIFFTIQPSVILLAIGFFIWMFSFPIIEAVEHTIIQNVIPLERQGRVFGFAQSIESASTPITTFLIGPLTHFIFVPFMTTGWGAQVLGPWFGTGPARAIALVFTLTGIIGLTVTQIARFSKPAKLLSKRYLENM